MIEVREFDESDIDEAARLFEESFQNARACLPLIPSRADVRGYAVERLHHIADHRGFTARSGGRLVGYLIERFTSDEFMGERTGFSIGLYPFAVSGDEAEYVCQLLYRSMARSWVEREYHAHNLSYFATDERLSSVLFRLGFGMTHFQLFRDLHLPSGEIPAVDIRYIDERSQIAEIDAEHKDYYPNAPLFWIPHDYLSRKRGEPKDKPQETVEDEGQIIAAFVRGSMAGYFVLTKGTAETELFVDPGNGQIKSAYARPEYRGMGIGKALLAETVRWAKRNELKRLYVEGESANIYGGRFWWKHFKPAEYFVRRSVDRRVRADMFGEA